MTRRLTRRGFVGAGGIATAGLAAAAPALSGAAATSPPAQVAATTAPPVRERPIALARPAPLFALVQSERRDVDPARAAEDLGRNLARIGETVSAVQAEGGHKDWIAFHDAVLTGASSVAVERDGPQVRALAQIARRHGCWLSLGLRLRSAPHPGGTVEAVAFLSPAGELSSLQPADGARALAPGYSLVAVTAFGNLAASPRTDDPALYAERVAAGAEFLLRTSAGPMADWALDVPVCCRAHRIHGAVIGAALPPGTPPGAMPASAGGSAFFGPDGRQLAVAEGSSEQFVAFAVPVAAQRAALTGRA